MEDQVVTRDGVFGGEPLTYEARLGSLVVPDRDGSPGALYVYVSYQVTEPHGGQPRPVLFAFNGGPGSAAVWLHLGWLGPHRLAAIDQLTPSPPLWAVVENPDAPLDVADLVLVDPPGTGWSRLLQADRAPAFYGVEEDAEASLRFVRAWCRRHGRDDAPLFWLGESYGAVRVAVMAGMSAGGPTATGRTEALAPRGIILVGASLQRLPPSGDTAVVSALTPIAAAAWYHGRVPQPAGSLAEHVAMAREVARRDYLMALHAGFEFPSGERRRLAEQLYRLTGLSPTVALSAGLRLTPSLAATHLLADAGLRLSLYDGRYSGPAGVPETDPVADDPALGRFIPVFAGAVEPYLRTVFPVVPQDEYIAINFREVNAHWRWSAADEEPGGPNYAAELARALARHPTCEVLVMGGWFDGVAPPDATYYAMFRYPVDEGRIHRREYPSGHMPYWGEDSRRQMSQDLRMFLRRLASR